MSKRKNGKKPKNTNLKVNFTEIKKWKSKKHLLIALQSLCGALIGVCFFLYYLNSKVTIESYDGETENRYATFVEISKEYYDSDIYKENLSLSVSNILRFVAIREQMETDGSFDPNKLINIGEYANRYSDEEYTGPEVYYYLDDLIKWGQKAANNSEFYYSYEFYTTEQYCDFFNLDLDTYLLENGSPEYDDSIVTSFETLKNQYYSVDNKGIEEYVDNEEDYAMLTACLVDSCNDLYSNYLEYLSYTDYFTESATNLKYVVTMGGGTLREIYTNSSLIFKGVSEEKIDNVMKNYGEYIYAYPGTLNYVTNTPIEYDTIKNIVIDEYAYAYPDDARIWISLDTSYSVVDSFSENMLAFSNTRRIIPFLISFGAVAFVGFMVLFVTIVKKEQHLYNFEGSKDALAFFDKVPIEVWFLALAIVFVALYILESVATKNVEVKTDNRYSAYFGVEIFFIFIDIYMALLFIYGFLRRLVCKNILDGSIISMLSPHFSKFNGKIQTWFYRMYDSTGVAIRTWAGYIGFLLVNVFFATLLFFGQSPLLAFCVLLVFDIVIGITLFNRNYERKKIIDGIKQISNGDYNYKIDGIKMHGDNKELAAAVNDVGLGLEKAVQISTKDEKLKADLITNVSHDIKTPLTSIINYVDLLKRENIEDEKAKKYIAVLDEKSQRLRQLTFDLVEASKITSGNISIDLNKINFVEFIKQAVGEFEDRLEEKGLDLVVNTPSEPVMIMADPRHLWRVLENLLNNVCKYALTGTRVYLDVVTVKDDSVNQMVMSLKNISGSQLNIPADELTERFIRGDVSRSTEGSGLGLSIAKNLTKAQKGIFEIYLDGDLFKVTLTFDICE